MEKERGAGALLPMAVFVLAVGLASLSQLPAATVFRQQGEVTCNGAITEVRAQARNVGMGVAHAKQGGISVNNIRGTFTCNGNAVATADVQLEIRVRYKLQYKEGQPRVVWEPSDRPTFFSVKQVTIGTVQANITGSGTFNFSNLNVDLAQLAAAALSVAPEGDGRPVARTPFFDPNGLYRIRLINAKCNGKDIGVPDTLDLPLQGGKGNAP